MNSYMLDVLEQGERVASTQALEDHIGTMDSFLWRMPTDSRPKIKSITVRDRQRIRNR